MSNFKVGDRVFIVEYDGQTNNSDIVGKTGTVRKLQDSTLGVGVEFDDKIRNGHGQFGSQWGHGWWCLEASVRKIEDKETKTNKGENKDMTELLNRIKTINERRIKEDAKNKRKEIENNSEQVKAILELEKTINSLDPKIRKTISFTYFVDDILFTDEELAKFEKINDDKVKAESELDEKLANAKAQLSICETYEQKMEVLKAYGFVDDSGKIIA